MENESKILLVAEGSGGHLIPAFEVARALAQAGARVKVWYAQRPSLIPLAQAFAHEAPEGMIEISPLPTRSSGSAVARLRQCGKLWSEAQHCLQTFEPDVVVGFGGWVSAPVVLAALQRRIGCLVHEQNVILGRANRWLAQWVDCVALSYLDARHPAARRHAVLTGMPVRQGIGHASRQEAAERFGLSADRPTLLVLGGSQGAGFLNQLCTSIVTFLTPEERAQWQWIHVTGPRDAANVKEAYVRAGVNAWVEPFLVEMEAAYAHADLVIARAGASTIAELARCGTPAILIPYPHANGHQRVNAKMVEEAGGGIVLEEQETTPERALSTTRRLLANARLRATMGVRMRTLDVTDAADRLTQAILELRRAPHAN